MLPREGHSLYIAVVALTAANSTTPIARRAKENSPRRTAVGSTRASRPAPERGGRRYGRMLLPPRSGAGHGTVFLPVLTHWATFFRPAGWSSRKSRGARKNAWIVWE